MKEFELPQPDESDGYLDGTFEPLWCLEKLRAAQLAAVEAYKAQLSTDKPFAYCNEKIITFADFIKDTSGMTPLYTRPMQAGAQSVAVPDEPIQKESDMQSPLSLYLSREVLMITGDKGSLIALCETKEDCQQLIVGLGMATASLYPNIRKVQVLSLKPPAPEQAQNAENQRNVLCETIIEAARKCGLVNKDAPIDGANCLMLIDDMATIILQNTRHAEQAQTVDDLTKAALELYKAPFTRSHGYIFDDDSCMVADQAGANVALRIRGWGRISYKPDPEQLQDKVGDLFVEALNEFWPKRAALAKGGA